MPESRMLLLALCALVVACRGGESRNAAAADTLNARASAAAVLAPLAPVRALSIAEAEFAAQAAQRAFREDVRRYAQVIATDHRAVVGILDSLARARGVGYEATPAARELENAVRLAHSGRDSLTGADFDLAYIRGEVESYRQLIDRVDQELIPGMGAAPERVVLYEVRAMADAHLTRARQILAVALRETPVLTVARPATPVPRPTTPVPRPTTPVPRPTPRPVDTLPRVDTARRPVPDTGRRPPPDTGRRPVRPDTLVRQSLRES
jgi:predicted outer membrane protein